MITWNCPAAYWQKVALPNVAAGAKEAGRAAPPLIAHTPVIVHDNASEARDAAWAALGNYQRLPYYMFEHFDSGRQGLCALGKGPRLRRLLPLFLALLLLGAACGGDSNDEPVIDPGDGGAYAPSLDPARFIRGVDNPSSHWLRVRGGSTRVRMAVSASRSSSFRRRARSWG